MLTNHCSLLRRLFQDTLGHNIRSCFLRNDELSESIANMFQRISNKAKSRIVKNLFLHTKNDTQFRFRTHFSQCTEELEIQNDFSFITRRQVWKKFINNNQVTLIRIFFRKSYHHVLNNILQTFYTAILWHLKIDATFIKIILHVSHDDIVQWHNNATDFDT